jgi:hypothetical protein
MSDARIGILDPGIGTGGASGTSEELGEIARYLLNSLTRTKVGPQDAVNLIRAAREVREHVRIEDHLVTETVVTALVGKVQSGKTTGVALATSVLADSGVDCFIVLTGTKKTLTEQTGGSLAEMFGHFHDHPNWFWNFVNSSGKIDETFDALKNHFDVPNPGNRRVLLVVTIMKEDDYLEALNEALNRLEAEDIDISGRFVVFDDEADQGSPNRARVGSAQPSSLNRLIGELRDKLGVHSFIPVTATPQALLLDLPDGFVRPDKAVLLSPGSKYVGGRVLFRENLKHFLRTVLPPDMAAINNRSLEPPKGMLDAVATFLLTAQLINKTGNSPSPISMLIHPHRETQSHKHVIDWLNRILDFWRSTVMNSSELSQELCFKIFERAAKDLATSDSTSRITSAGYSTVGLDLEHWIRDACAPIRSPLLGIRKISGQDSFSYKEWDTKAMWILVGGDVLGRGFVVEGLTTTYMTRDVRPNARYNMDTMQQRARFFGYKREYLDVLRGWFPPSLSEKFEDYVLHEDVMWLFLENQMKLGRNLRDARTIFLESEFGRSTRTTANRGQSRSQAIPSGWIKQHYLFDQSLEQNLVTFQEFVATKAEFGWWHPPRFSKMDIEFKSAVCDVPTAIGLLDAWKFISVDMPVVYALADHLKNLELDRKVRIIDMTSKRTSAGLQNEIRERGINSRHRDAYGANPWNFSDYAQITNLFMGTAGQRDDDCFDEDSFLTIQVYAIKPTVSNSQISSRVGAIAIHFEDPLLKRVLGERNGNQ